MPNPHWPFAKSRRYVHGLDLDSPEHFQVYVDERDSGNVLLPEFIPAQPDVVYKSQFLGWDDFLGINLRPILPFDEALYLVARMGFTTLNQWKAYFNNQIKDAMPFPNGLSAYPELDYVNQFKGYNDWFKRKRIQFRGLREAKEFLYPLPVKTEDDWWAYVNGKLPNVPPLPEDIPFIPSLVYGRYWQGFHNFLNPDVEYLPFDDARDYVRALGLRSIGQWRDYIQGELEEVGQLPDNIPAYPEKFYSEFTSYVDWLYPEGQKWRSYEAASYYVSQFKFETKDEFIAWRKGERPDLPPPPEDIPKTPWVVYEDEWSTAYAFLNDGKPRFRSFVEAKKFLRPLGLRTSNDWKDYCEGKKPELPPKPKDIPSNPFIYYFDEYEGIHDFLGVFCY